MQTTPNFALSYPEPQDHTRTWEYWQTLAVQLDTLLNSRPGAILATGGRVTGTDGISGGNEVGLLRLDNIPVRTGRLYRAVLFPTKMGATTDAWGRIVFRHALNAGPASSSSPMTAYRDVWISNGGGQVEDFGASISLLIPNANGTLSMYVGVAHPGGPGQIYLASAAPTGIDFLVYDDGPWPPGTGVPLSEPAGPSPV